MKNNYLHRKWVMRIILFILLLGAVGMTKAMAQTNTYTLASAPIKDTIKAKTVGIIPYSDDFITQEEVMERYYAITSFRMIDTTTVAVLTGASNMILVYSLNQNQILRKIQLPISARAFDYSDGVFHAVGDRTYLSVDINGNILNRMDFKKPGLDFFLISDLYIIDGQPIIHECNLNTYHITPNDLQEIDTSYYHYASGYKLRPNYNNGRGCNIVYQTPMRVNRTIGLSVDALGLEGKIACIHPISIDSNQIALNIQTGVDHPINFAKSYLVVMDLNGELISKVEVPINFISWISKPFFHLNNNWYYAFSGEEGITFYKIDKHSNMVVGPDSYDMTEIDIPHSLAEPNIIPQDINDMATSRGNWRTLTQAWENAEEYCDLEWTPIPANVSEQCTNLNQSGYYITTPITNSYYTEIGVPYSWGGFTDQRSFVNLASLGRYTGNIVTTSSTCGGNAYEAGASDAYVIGVDCSGFVTRCWEHGSHVWTGAIPDISSYIATINASTYSNTSLFQTGDALNWSDNNNCNFRHVMMYAYHNSNNGDIHVFESTTGNYNKTTRNSHDLSYFQGYSTCYGQRIYRNYTIQRYYYMRDIRLRLGSAIALSQNNIPVTDVTYGQPLRVDYSVYNAGSETWRGYVRLFIEQSDGDVWCINNCDVDNKVLTTIYPGQTKDFTFSNNEVISEPGTTKIYVKVVNEDAGDYGWDHPYNVGDGDYSNPLVFEIVNPNAGSCKTCPDYDEVWAITEGEWTYRSSSIGSNGCRIYIFPCYSNYTYTFQTCGNGTANFDTRLYLYNSSCTQVASNDDANGCTGNLSSLEYTNTGNAAYYYLKIDGYNGEGGSFTIAAKREGQEPPSSCNDCPDYDETWNILTDGEWQTRSSSIDSDGCRIYRVALLPSYTYTFQTCNPGSASFDTRLYLYNQSCSEVVSDDDGCTGTSSSLEYTNTGNAGFYYLKIDGYNGSGGSFTIAGKREGTAPSCPDCPDYDESWSINDVEVGDWTTKSSSIGTDGCRIYRVPLLPSYTYTFQTGCDNGTADFDTRLYLYDASCNEVTYDDDGCSNSLSSLKYRNATGSTAYYYLKIDGYNGEGGSFTIAAKRESCSNCPEYDEYWNTNNVGEGEWTYKSSSIVSGGCSIYRVRLNASYTYTFQTGCDHGTANFDTRLYLYDASCNQVAYNDDGCSNNLSSIEYTNTTGSNAYYYLKINGYGSASGSYTIAAKRAITYVIDVSANPSEGGSVSGSGTYESGSTCTLTATPAAGYSFVRWTKNGSQVSTTPSYSFTVTENASYVAVFSLNSYTISASASPSSGGSVSGSGSYNYGSTCNLTATPATGYTFTNWTKNGTVVSTNANYSFTVTSSGTYVANFSLNSYTISASANPTTGGSVSGTGSYNYGSTCTLTATPATGYSFVRWTKNGSQVSTNLSYSFTVTANASYVAVFSLNTYTISASASPSAGGTVSGGGTYNYGSSCTLTATPATGYSFVRWTKNGSQVSTNPSYSFTVTANASYVAVFEQSAITQSQTLSTGWNWWSSYVELSGTNGLGMLENSLGSAGQMIKSRSDGYVESYTYNGATGWFGPLTSISNEQMYKINMNSSSSAAVTGYLVNTSNHPITIGSGWNWIGFPLIQPVGVAGALSGFSPAVGDILKGRNSYTTYYSSNGTMGWYGSLNTLEPGCGYMYQSLGSGTKTLVYQTGRGEDLVENITPENNVFQPLDQRFADNMSVTAVVEVEDEELRSDRHELAAFVDGECRGSVRLLYVEPIDRYVAFLTVFGETGEALEFRLTDGTDMQFSTDMFAFASDGTEGTLASPKVLHFGTLGMGETSAMVRIYPNPVRQKGMLNIALPEASGKMKVEIDNMLGVIVFREEVTLDPTSAVRISLPDAVLPGTYVLKVTRADGHVYYGKLVVK